MGEIRIFGPGKTQGHPYPVCKKNSSTCVSTLRTSVTCVEHHMNRWMDDLRFYLFNSLSVISG